jgi:molybdopterin/thiamine biosynthesis adenylyltransferase
MCWPTRRSTCTGAARRCPTSCSAWCSRARRADRPVTGEDLADQFLLTAEDLGRSLTCALAVRVSELDEAIDIGAATGPAGGVSIAVPAAGEVAGIDASDARVTAWGQVLSASVYIGPEPVRLNAEPPRTPLTAALAAVCGGLLAQSVLRQLAAIVAGPAVLGSWFEEHLWLAHPGIGTAARAAIAEKHPWPALPGLLERVSPGSAQRFQVLVDGQPAAPEPRVVTVVNDDAVVVAVRRAELTAVPAAIRPGRAAVPAVEPLLWSPVAGPVLDEGAVAGDDWPASALPAASVVVCGAGALGSWATAVLAASRIPGMKICVVDMDHTIETHNLNRQVLFGDADVGEPKARVAARRLVSIDPGLDVRALQLAITPVVASELAGRRQAPVQVAGVTTDLAEYRASVAALGQALESATAVLSCPDNHQTRWSLNVLTETLGIPLIDGAIAGFLGRLHVCDPADDGQCLVCWLGTSIAKDATRHRCTDLVGDEPVPAIVTAAAVIGAAQAAVLIAHLSGAGQRISRYHAFDGTAGMMLAAYRAGDRHPDECPAHLFGQLAELRATDGAGAR